MRRHILLSFEVSYALEELLDHRLAVRDERRDVPDERAPLREDEHEEDRPDRRRHLAAAVLHADADPRDGEREHHQPEVDAHRDPSLRLAHHAQLPPRPEEEAAAAERRDVPERVHDGERGDHAACGARGRR